MILQDIWKWLKGKVRAMLPKASVERELHVTISESEAMKRAIDEWMSMYKDSPGWKKADTVTLNLPAAISAEFARLILTEFSLECTGSAMATFVDEQMKKALKARFRTVSLYCALGGIVAKVYPTDVDPETGRPTRVAVDWIAADDFYPVAFDSSNNVTSAVFAQFKYIGDHVYTRLELHEQKGRTYTVTNKAYKARMLQTTGADSFTLDTLLQEEVPLASVEEWAGIEPVTTMSGMLAPLFVYIKVPTPNTVDTESPLGVSVYSLAVEQIQAADEQYGRTIWEFEATEAAIDADQSLFDFDKMGRPIIPKGKDRLYRTYAARRTTDGKPLLNTFSPVIRDQSLLNGLNEHLYRIEWLCGLAYGTLSHAQEVEKTATEIRMAKQRSYHTVCLMQDEWDEGLKQLAIAIQEIAVLYGMAPNGSVDVNITFGDGVLEDTDVEYQRRWAMVQAGKLKPELFLSWYFGCSVEEALEMMPEQAEDAESLFPRE